MTDSPTDIVLPEQPINPPQPKLPPARLTVVEQVVHQVPTDPGGPAVATSRFSRPLKTLEQTYKRRMTVGETPTPLDCGWLRDSCGMLVVENAEGRFAQVYPTDEERAAVDARVVEVQFGAEAAILISPGESCRFQPIDPTRIALRCRSGRAVVQVTLVPS